MVQSKNASLLNAGKALTAVENQVMSFAAPYRKILPRFN
jgi:hypothetical protein